jgi:hypothetical protein
MVDIKQVIVTMLRRERLSADLDDSESKILLDWLVDSIERLGKQSLGKSVIDIEVKKLIEKARVLSKIVCLWNKRKTNSGCFQLLASSNLEDCIPTPNATSLELLESLVSRTKNKENENSSNPQKIAA